VRSGRTAKLMSFSAKRFADRLPAGPAGGPPIRQNRWPVPGRPPRGNRAGGPARATPAPEPMAGTRGTLPRRKTSPSALRERNADLGASGGVET
jgi:hypothetical protein